MNELRAQTGAGMCVSSLRCWGRNDAIDARPNQSFAVATTLGLSRSAAQDGRLCCATCLFTAAYDDVCATRGDRGTGRRERGRERIQGEDAGKVHVKWVEDEGYMDFIVSSV